MQQIGHNLKLKKMYIWWKVAPGLEALKEAKDILSTKKQDRKKWQVFLIKLKAELKAFCKAAQKVVNVVACSVR